MMKLNLDGETGLDEEEESSTSVADVEDTSPETKIDEPLKEELVEKLTDIKNKEKELLKAKEELFDVDKKKSGSTEDEEADNEEKTEKTNPNNIEIKVKIEKPDDDDEKDKSTSSLTTGTTLLVEEESTSISTSSPENSIEQKTENISLDKKDRDLNETSSAGLVDKINEIKQKQQELDVAKESIMNELKDKDDSSDSSGTESKVKPTDNQDKVEPKVQNQTQDAEKIANKIKEIKSKELELNEAKESLFNNEGTEESSSVSPATLKPTESLPELPTSEQAMKTGDPLL